jgi:cytochrome c oxidase assembly protein subunit 15
MAHHPPTRPAPWPHRLAVALALVTFPLIWVGGLVTTYDAGMAVPDWPGTFGYNLFAYPWQTWIAGPWDIFIEHGHRLLGATAGLVAIALVAVAWLNESRRWVFQVALGALILVILQGILGGARVLLDERLVALIHGCVGPLFFAYLAFVVVATSTWWRDTQPLADRSGHKFARAAWTTVGLAAVQLFLGAIVRHVPLSASVVLFRAAMLLHLVVAGVLTIHLLLTPFRAWQMRKTHRGLAGRGLVLPALVVVQLLLGLGSYVAKYAWPAWLSDYQFAAAFVVQEKSLSQSLVTTAHVANGSLILFCSVLLAVRASRLFSERNGAGVIARSDIRQTETPASFVEAVA